MKFTQQRSISTTSTSSTKKLLLLGITIMIAMMQPQSALAYKRYIDARAESLGRRIEESDEDEDFYPHHTDGARRIAHHHDDQHGDEEEMMYYHEEERAKKIRLCDHYANSNSNIRVRPATYLRGDGKRIRLRPCKFQQDDRYHYEDDDRLLGLDH
mmetsp:Transcript_17172/g.48269  ORF Transcript_17172/g.48269 Transcript_17172/m.48269 type:complete len:156 (-) Transcript_17172:207-674(-)